MMSGRSADTAYRIRVTRFANDAQASWALGSGMMGLERLTLHRVTGES